VAGAVQTLKPKFAVLDGEIVAVDPAGRHSFSALQGRGSVPKGWHVVLYAFDLLNLNGQDLTGWPLVKRKAALEKALAGSTVLFCPELVGDPEDIIASVKSLGLEGIVAKRRESTYQSGDRSGAWLKYKTSPAQEFVVGGFKSDGKSFESLLVGCYEGKRLKFAGKVRAGFRPHNRRSSLSWKALFHKSYSPGLCSMSWRTHDPCASWLRV
jgi:bifunctional non-homologous end joining protein LigD